MHSQSGDMRTRWRPVGHKQRFPGQTTSGVASATVHCKIRVSEIFEGRTLNTPSPYCNLRLTGLC